MKHLLKILPHFFSTITNETSVSLEGLLSFYGDDFPHFLAFESELTMWKHKWMREKQLASTLNTSEKAIPYADEDFFANIRVLLSIMATLPVTSCECERSISMLKLKTPVHSTMGQDRLNALSLMYNHRDIDLNPEEVEEEFTRCHPRRMLL